MENLWSIIDEVTYRDPVPKTMGELKTRLRQARKKVPSATLKRADSFCATTSEKCHKKKTKGDIQATEIVREKNVNIGY